MESIISREIYWTYSTKEGERYTELELLVVHPEFALELLSGTKWELNGNQAERTGGTVQAHLAEGAGEHWIPASTTTNPARRPGIGLHTPKALASFFHFTKMPYRLVAALRGGGRGRLGEKRRKEGQWKKWSPDLRWFQSLGKREPC